jgi:hypothetical protein
MEKAKNYLKLYGWKEDLKKTFPKTTERLTGKNPIEKNKWGNLEKAIALSTVLLPLAIPVIIAYSTYKGVRYSLN